MSIREWSVKKFKQCLSTALIYKLYSNIWFWAPDPLLCIIYRGLATTAPFSNPSMVSFASLMIDSWPNGHPSCNSMSTLQKISQLTQRNSAQHPFSSATPQSPRQPPNALMFPTSGLSGSTHAGLKTSFPWQSK